MRSLITLVVLCTVFFITINAAPVLPSGYELETLGNRDAQTGSELEQASVNVVSSLLSAASKIADQNDDLQQSPFNGFNSVLSSLGKQLSNEEGEIQSDDENLMMQALFGTPLVKSDEVHVQLDNEQLLINLISAVRAIFSALRNESDPNGEAPRILDGIDSILSAVEKRLNEGEQSVGDNEIRRIILDFMDTIISALRKTVEPYDEMASTFFNGFATLLSFIRYKIENGEGVLQSSDDEMKQAVMNILGNNGEIQTADDDELERTFINIMKVIFSAYRRNFDNKFAQTVFDVADTVFSFIGKGNGRNIYQPTDEEFLNMFTSPFNTWVKGVEKGKIKSPNGAGEAKTPQWGGILGSLATGVLNKYLSG